MDKHTRKRLRHGHNVVYAAFQVFAAAVMDANKSGYSFEEIADAMGVTPRELKAAMGGREVGE